MFSNELFCLMLDTYGELDELFIITPKDQILLTPALTPTSVGPSKPIPVYAPAPAPVLKPNDATKKPVSKKSIQHKSIIMSKKCMTLEDKKREKARERGRIQAQRHRDRRKAKFLESIKHLESLQKQNEALKKQICTLKKQLNELIICCKNQQAARIKF